MIKNIAISLFTAVFALMTASVPADNGKPDLWKVEKDGKKMDFCLLVVARLLMVNKNTKLL